MTVRAYRVRLYLWGESKAVRVVRRDVCVVSQFSDIIAVARGVLRSKWRILPLDAPALPVTELVVLNRKRKRKPTPRA